MWARSLFSTLAIAAAVGRASPAAVVSRRQSVDEFGTTTIGTADDDDSSFLGGGGGSGGGSGGGGGGGSGSSSGQGQGQIRDTRPIGGGPHGNHPGLNNNNCNDLQLFLARGSNEPEPGRLSNVTDLVCVNNPSCGVTNIHYPAAIDDYCDSVGKGVVNGVAQMTAYNKRCPGSRLGLLGFSQGAHVAGDMIGGGGGLLFGNEWVTRLAADALGGGFNSAPGCMKPASLALRPDQAPGNMISFIGLMGDVRHTQNQSYNVLNGSYSDGVWPRRDEQLQRFNLWSGFVRSWCYVEDPVCARGLDRWVHTDYFKEYAHQMAAWVNTVMYGSPGGVNGASSSFSPSSTSSSSGSSSSHYPSGRKQTGWGTPEGGDGDSDALPPAIVIPPGSTGGSSDSTLGQDG